MEKTNLFKMLWARITRIVRAPVPPPITDARQRYPTESSLGDRPGVLHTQHRDRFMQIGPDALIYNATEQNIILESALIRRLVVPSKGYARIKSPVIETVRDLSLGGTMIREWDALYVANNMIEEFARGIAYDQMEAEDLRHSTLPFPKRALARYIEKSGLKAMRDNESNSAEARQQHP